MNQEITIPQPRKLQFLPDDFRITVWSKLKPYYDELLKRRIRSVEELETWIRDLNELDAVVGEELRWRYIRLTQNSEDERATELYDYAVQELSPKISLMEHKLNQKLVDSAQTPKLAPATYHIYLREKKKDIRIFREENIPLITREQLLSKEYGSLFSKMTVEVKGETLTLQQASALLEETDRDLREEVYFKIQERMKADRELLESLFDELLAIRHDIARNAGFKNYRDYKFVELGRFDYSVSDCTDFHQSIETEVVPLTNKMFLDRKEKLGYSRLKPWDLQVDPSGKPPLKPFRDAAELVDRSVRALATLDPYFGTCLETMDHMGRLDLDSRKGKHPGGYNMPLPYSGVPFIFMNATSTLSDLHTLMHEAGHAVHALLTRHYELTTSKEVPSEVAELASMSMELLSMDHWNLFFSPEDLQRAKIQQLEGVVKTLPWVATIDEFQHWLYTHPTHNREARKQAWNAIYSKYTSEQIDREGTEDYADYLWHRQLHLFEVPFYYIEYGMAQLGAIAIWKRFRENPGIALDDYKKALSLGYTKTIGEIYETAGIAFNFQKEYVHELAAFVNQQLDKILGN